MRALVTGGAGFIGSHLADALVDRGDEVLAFDDLSTGRRDNLSAALDRGSELVVDEITDPGVLSATVANFEPGLLFHLAAQVDVRRAMSDPALDAGVNVLGTLHVLEAARARGTPVVFASTGGAIYGEGDGRPLPLDEAAECRPETPYGMSKLAGEGYLDLYRRVHGLPSAALRLANVYGPRQDPHGEAGVVAIFCGKLERGEAPTVFGDGRQTRDYVYVADVVDAMLLAGERLAAGRTPALPPLNVGTGKETSVLELIERLRDLAGRGEFEGRMAPARPGEVQRIALDSSAAARELGWGARTGLDRGLALTVDSLGSAPPVTG
jgi:UDP-glucose 4-epimerase